MKMTGWLTPIVPSLIQFYHDFFSKAKSHWYADANLNALSNLSLARLSCKRYTIIIEDLELLDNRMSWFHEFLKKTNWTPCGITIEIESRCLSRDFIVIIISNVFKRAVKIQFYAILPSFSLSRGNKPWYFAPLTVDNCHSTPPYTARISRWRTQRIPDGGSSLP